MSEYIANVKRRAANVLPLLNAGAEAAQEEDRDGDASIMTAAADVLRSVAQIPIPRGAWEEEGPRASGVAPAPAAAAAPTDKHRHKYGPDGKCTVDGCAAVSREAKKAAKAGAQQTLTGDGAGPVQS